MHLKLVAPLLVSIEGRKTKMELLPVAMHIGFPSKTPCKPGESSLWLKFLRPMGVRLDVSEVDLARIQRYMREHGTEALSENGITAWTVTVGSLAECMPHVCGEPEELALCEF